MGTMHDQNAAHARVDDTRPAPAGGAVEGASALDRFLVRAAERRAEQEAHPERMAGSWVDPDPKAIAALPAKRHPVAIYMRELGQAPEAVAKRRNVLRHVVAELADRPRADVTWEDVLTYPWHHVSADLAEDFHLSICHRYPNEYTRNMYVACLRSVISRCQRARLISRGAAAEIVEQLPTKAVRARAQHARRLKPSEIAALIQACQHGSSFIAARDAAMVALFATTGMRVSELTKLDLGDWDQASQILTLRRTKNGRDRLVPVDTRVTSYLAAWLAVRGKGAGPLFTRSEGRRGHRAHLSTHAVRERLTTLAARAGIGTVQTHDFRRTVATALLRTHDAALTGRLLGHANLASTMTYDMAGMDEHRLAVGTLPLPEFGDVALDVEKNAS